DYKVTGVQTCALPISQTSDKPEAVAPYAATLTVVVDAMLKLADVGPNDFVIDLGSGDGRIVIAAATRFNARRGLGVDIEPKLVKIGRASCRERVQRSV